MVLTSSTQWTIPLMSAPAVKPGSVVGLKTCHFHGPPSLTAAAAAAANSTHHHQQDSIDNLPSSFSKRSDLQSSSSRRLQAIVADPKGRSAGSFRLEDTFSCSNWPSSDDDINNVGLFDEEKNVMPWSTSSPANIAHILEVEGDITAADVDLLPMPGLVGNYAPPFYESCFSFSPSSSCESISTSHMAPLGLPPPDLHREKTATHAQFRNFAEYGFSCCDDKNIVGQGNEHFAGVKESSTNDASSYLPVPQTSLAMSGSFSQFANKTVDSGLCKNTATTDVAFTESLAGLWSHSDHGQMLHDPVGLASILHSTSSSWGQSTTDANEVLNSAFVMSELDQLMMPTKERSNTLPLTHYPSVLDGATASFLEGRDQSLWKSEPPIASAPQLKSEEVKTSEEVSTVTELESSAQALSLPFDTAFIGGGYALWLEQNRETGLKGNWCSEPQARQQSVFSSSPRPSTPKKNLMHSFMEDKNDSNSIAGKKRPFSALQRHEGNMSSMISDTNAWPVLQESSIEMMGRPSPESQEDMSYSFATHAFSAMLYKFQGGLQGRPQMSTHDMIGATMNPPPTKVRRRHGTAMDPQSIAARTRRERFSDRIRILQSLVPNGERLDTVSMLGQTLEYVRFLQHQVWQLYHGLDPESPNNLKCEKWKEFIEGQPAPTN